MSATVGKVKEMVYSLSSDTTCSPEERRERLLEILRYTEVCLEALIEEWLTYEQYTPEHRS